MNVTFIALGLLLGVVAIFVMSRLGGVGSATPQREEEWLSPFDRYPSSPDRERDQIIHQEIVALAEDFFPDNIGLAWPIEKLDHRGPFSLVKVTPEPPDVGYARLAFIITFASDTGPEVVGVYVEEESELTLLATGGSLSVNLPETLDF